MELRRLLRPSLTFVLIFGATLAGNASPAAATTQGACYGTIACAGQDPAASGCTGSQQLVQDVPVPDLGDIQLFHSGVCATSWATLVISRAYIQPGSGPWPELAEIFYEPPQGGPEQFETAQWNLQTNSTTTTLMVPDSGSVKACGGDPNDSTDPFDEDPQGANGLTQDQTQNPTFYTTGACTLWH
jgi:Protein of unknown function (DUF2690)